MAGAFLDGVNVASLALMAVVTSQLGRCRDRGSVTVVIGLWRPLLLPVRLNSGWLVLGGAAAVSAPMGSGIPR